MIETFNISKEYSGRSVLSDVSITAKDGKVTGFVGPNGAGKSTFLKIVAGITSSSSGKVVIDGIPFISAGRPAAHLGVFLSAEWIPGNMTAESFLSYVCDTQRLSGRRVKELLSAVGLAGASHRRVKGFSLGMRQRLGIAAAFASDAQNVILDEPINGLDPDAIQWIRHLLREVANEGKAVLLSSHHMSELAKVADDVVLLDGGRIARQGPLDSFIAQAVRAVYIESSQLDDVIRELTAADYIVSRSGAGALVQDSKPNDIGRIIYRANYDLDHLSVHTRSLEDTYFDTIRPNDTALEEFTR